MVGSQLAAGNVCVIHAVLSRVAVACIAQGTEDLVTDDVQLKHIFK